MKRAMVYALMALIAGVLTGGALGWYRFSDWPQNGADMEAGEGVVPIAEPEE